MRICNLFIYRLHQNLFIKIRLITNTISIQIKYYNVMKLMHRTEIIKFVFVSFIFHFSFFVKNEVKQTICTP